MYGISLSNMGMRVTLNPVDTLLRTVGNGAAGIGRLGGRVIPRLYGKTHVIPAAGQVILPTGGCQKNEQG